MSEKQGYEILEQVASQEEGAYQSEASSQDGGSADHVVGRGAQLKAIIEKLDQGNESDMPTLTLALLGIQQVIGESVANAEALVRDSHRLIRENNDTQETYRRRFETNVSDLVVNTENSFQALLDRIDSLETKVNGRLDAATPRVVTASKAESDASSPGWSQYPPGSVQDSALRAAQRRIGELEAQIDLSGSHLGEEEIQERISEIKDAHDSEIAALRTELDNIEEKHRHTLEELQSMKGNIRVMCRIRPPLGHELEEPVVDFGPELPGEFTNKWGRFEIPEHEKSAMGTRLKTRALDVERIFGPASSNKEIFKEVKDLIECSLRGDQVCVFCYGASGSGKTFTMGGGAPTPGLIDQTMTMVFSRAEHQKDKYKYTFELSIIEIYRDVIFDLTKSGMKVKIGIEDAQWVYLDSVETAHATVRRAIKNREVGETNINKHSSRSHMVFALRVARKPLRGTEKEVSGLLNLIDLAGSERAEASNSKEGFEEGRAINMSLSDLTGMLDALGKGTQLVPMTTLGRLLKPSFGAGSKTLMFVNVSPLQKDYHMTKQTLERGENAYKAKLEQMKPKVPKPARVSSVSRAPTSSPATPPNRTGRSSTTPGAPRIPVPRSGAAGIARGSFKTPSYH